MGSKEMRIAGFLRETGLPRSTVRFYERVGLLAPDLSAAGNGYRVYGPQHVERARLVRLGQGLGFSIREILALMRAWDGGTLSEAEKRDVLRAKLAEVEAKLADLELMRGYLRQKLAWMEAGGQGIPPALASVGQPAAPARRKARPPQVDAPPARA
jgi:MerR family copper efflux transcriptional regulator